ncbi:MFS transporter [Streptomyces sp. TRM S81-3]|uniref:MFS transporter n=1 Tax=Streptomyces griseicoloratus TaxID=2752516 RepID=A0A926L318_9ACTN|nr:MFS transporter [Streptomyces griseicoloratus]MBD0421622.1 MFS transporter [Streptomyces griseicoloratus]
MKTLRALRSFPLTVRLLLLNQFGIDVGFYLLIPYLATHLTADLGLSATLTGTVLGVRTLSQQGLFVLGGTAADRLGAHRVIPFGCALRTIGFALFALGDGIVTVFAASVLSGLAGALFYPAVRSYLAQQARDRQAEAFSLLNVCATAGGMIGLLLGSVFCLIDFRVCALSAAAVFAVLTVAQLFSLPVHQVRPTGKTVLLDWREALRHRGFLAFALTMMGMAALENQLYLLFTMGVRRASGWDGSITLLFLSGALAQLMLQLHVTRLTRSRGDAGRWIAPGLALMGLGFLPPVLVSGTGPAGGTSDAVLRTVPLAVGALLMCLGVMITQPSAMELVTRYAADGMTGTYFGLFYVLSGTAAAACNTGVGWVMDLGERTGRTWLPWTCCAALGLLSSCAVAWIHRHRALPADPAAVYA